MVNYGQTVEINKTNRKLDVPFFRVLTLTNDNKTAMLVNLFTGEQQVSDLACIIRDIRDKKIYISNMSRIKKYSIFE